MPKTIEDVVAEAEIKDLHIRYCRANDRRDEELMRSCFHVDAVMELHEPFDIDGFIAIWREVLGHYTATWHFTGNQLVEVAGDVAWAEHYTVSTHRIAADADGPERDFVASGRYVDRVERRNGEWKFTRRKNLIDLMRTDPVPASTPLMGNSGARDRTDPSYAARLPE
jgi:hypothetical protein